MTTPTPRRLRFNRWGLTENPLPGFGHRGYHVAWTIGKRHYLAEVVGIYRAEERAVTMLQTRHFNGEPGPDVTARFVEVVG